MGFSKSFSLLRSQQKADRRFVEDKINPTGRNSGTNSVEALGASMNLSNLRAASSNTTKSRMSLPLSDVAKSGTQSFSTTAPKATPESNDFDLFDKLSNRSLQDRGAMGNQDINLTKRKIKEVDTLANNEANRAMSMSLATQFPYRKYEAESSSAREIMNNSQAAIPTFLNRATASRLNPVSLSL